MPGKPAPGRVRFTTWIDGELHEDWKEEVPAGERASTLARLMGGEVLRRRAEKRKTAQGQTAPSQETHGNGPRRV